MPIPVDPGAVVPPRPASPIGTVASESVGLQQDGVVGEAENNESDTLSGDNEADLQPLSRAARLMEEEAEVLELLDFARSRREAVEFAWDDGRVVFDKAAQRSLRAAASEVAHAEWALAAIQSEMTGVPFCARPPRPFSSSDSSNSSFSE